MKLLPTLFYIVVSSAGDSLSPLQGRIPQTVVELWYDYDPRREALEIEVAHQWEEDDGVIRYVRYLIGTFKGVPAHMAAFYAFPKSGKQLPGILQMHGGGQRASLTEVKYYASRGYAALSVNWGDREMASAVPEDPNTDWGAVDPPQNNVLGYFSLQPDEKHLDPVESPRNCNWFLLTLGCRRALTFLERQPEVDADCLGIIGHSMGGDLTMYVAGTDARVKVASPSVGGTGFRTEPYYHLPPQIKQVNGDRDLFRRTMSFESYAPYIKIPILHLGSSNDFHGLMDATYATGQLIPHENQRYSFAPHFNHRFDPAQEVSRSLWLDWHLKGGLALPATPVSECQLKTADGTPIIHVTPDDLLPVKRVDIYYSVDADSRARFWRDATATGDGKSWYARLPLMNPEHFLFAFANVYYELPQAEKLHHGQVVEEVCISSGFHQATPVTLKQSNVKPGEKPELLIDDFTRGFHDWFSLNPDHPTLWEHWTRKVTDPKWRGPECAQLILRIRSEAPNLLAVVLKENAWRGYRGQERTYVTEVTLQGGSPETVVLELGDFRDTEEGHLPYSWAKMDQLAFCARYVVNRRQSNEELQIIAAQPWQGPKPTFERLEWRVSGDR